jgi:hypothetical protein
MNSSDLPSFVPQAGGAADVGGAAAGALPPAARRLRLQRRPLPRHHTGGRGCEPPPRAADRALLPPPCRPLQPSAPMPTYDKAFTLRRLLVFAGIVIG